MLSACGSDVNIVTIYTVELLSRSRSSFCNLSPIWKLLFMAYNKGAWAKPKINLKKKRGGVVEADCKWGKTSWKIPHGKLWPKKCHLYHEQQLDMPGWETEVAGEVCWNSFPNVLLFLSLDLWTLRAGKWWACSCPQLEVGVIFWVSISK